MAKSTKLRWFDTCLSALARGRAFTLLDNKDLPEIPDLRKRLAALHILTSQLAGKQQNLFPSLQELESWLDSHSAKSPGWASQAGERVKDILWLATLEADQVHENLRVKIWNSLREHARWLARRAKATPEEGLGLFLAGALCPGIRGAAQWKAKGWKILVESADKRILDDGVGANKNLAETASLIEILLTGLYIARATGVSIPDIYQHKLAHAGEYLRRFTDAGGNTPEGDGTYITSVTACVAAMFNRPDITPPRYEPELRNALFGVPPAAKQPEQGVHTFEVAGYTVGRHMAHEQEIWLAIDHGTNSSLAMWLHMDGKPVLVGNGNVLRMEGLTPLHKARRSSFETGHGYWQIDANHDGYVKQTGAHHRRRVSLTPLRGLTVEDSIACAQGKKVEICFTLDPSLTATARDNEAMVLRDGKPIMRIMHLSPLKLTVSAQAIMFSGTLAPAAKAVTDFTFLWPA